MARIAGTTTLILTIALRVFAADSVQQSAEIRLVSSDPDPQPFFAGAVPRTEFIADDASLNDVCGVGDFCWAVGERGVVVRSSDGGQTWSTQVLNADCSLKCVCFLTNQIGFVAGHRFDRFERRRKGVLLKTRDGGQTWSVPQNEHDLPSQQLMSSTIGVSQLPPLEFVRFFDLHNAVAIVSPDVDGAGSQVLRTTDGGSSWSVIPSDSPNTRLCFGAFASAQEGIVVGHSRTWGAVVGNRLVSLSDPQSTFRRIRGASISAGGSSWIAGDGGLLLHSDNGGIDWKPPTGLLSPKLGEILDYQTVDEDNGRVCVAGSPGGVVLYSDDNGKTWSFRPVANPAPIHRLKFTGASQIIAVGAFGIIHRSDDSGQTWQTVRNKDYRCAVLCLATEPHAIPFRMLAAVSGDQGYRSVVLQPSTQLHRGSADPRATRQRLQPAIAATGGNHFDQDWMFARNQPLQEEVRSELLRTWNRQTDSRVGQLLPQRMAQMIRTWRPDVICIDRSKENDQVAELWLQALGSAKGIADGSDPRGAILDKVGLSAWTVSRIFLRQPNRIHSSLSYDPADLLPNLGTSVELIAGESLLRSGLLTGDHSSTVRPQRIDAYTAYESGTATATPRHLMAGNIHAAGTESRRQLKSLAPEQQELLKKTVARDRVLRGALNGYIQQAGTPLGLTASLRSVGAQLPPQLALRQLLDLAAVYESVENLDGEIAVLKEITERFPDTPESVHAAEQLFQFYSSAELRFFRRQSGKSEMPNDEIVTAPKSIPGLPDTSRFEAEQTSGTITGNSIVKNAIVKRGVGTSFHNSNGSSQTAVDQRWDSNAHAALAMLNRLAPQRAGSPEILLRQAANLRRQGNYGQNSTVLSRAAAGTGMYALLATAELQSVHGAAESPVPEVNLPKASAKPLLDAVFTEQCWQDAFEIHLTAGADKQAAEPDCLIMLCWDKDHVYLSGRVEHVAGHHSRLDKTAPRSHDAAHGDFDRVSFTFDTDRDYTTGFHFTVDETGQTGERCWRAKNWNPQWYVAADADDRVWRFEIAIPQEEILNRPLRAGDLWGLRIHRTAPGILQQSLSNAESKAKNGSTKGWGLLRFVRNRK